MTAPTDAYQATVQHIELIATKIGVLQERQADAENQLIHRLACDYEAGIITAAGVHAVYKQSKGISVEGFRHRWNGRMPYELHDRRIWWTAVKYAPDPDGNWRGEYPFTDDCRTPPNKISVVYVLYDERNTPCYVGSTEQFRTRLSSHRREGKRFSRWMAYPCADREAAYAMEARLHAEHLPHLNRKAGR